uniref:Uncharacterized protein n=1 Tax=Anguilla anguilla TaxID=7936 RepID=A0A0E9PT48_ANGAN
MPCVFVAALRSAWAVLNQKPVSHFTALSVENRVLWVDAVRA